MKFELIDRAHVVIREGVTTTPTQHVALGDAKGKRRLFRLWHVSRLEGEFADDEDPVLVYREEGEI
jgi:hypothetical protein